MEGIKVRCALCPVVYSPAAPWSSQFPTLGQACSFLLMGSVFLSSPHGFFVSWGKDAVKFHFRCMRKLRWPMAAVSRCGIRDSS